jgi:phage-related protein
VIYLTRIGDTIYVLHAFEKDSRKTDGRDLDVAKSRFKLVLAQLRTAKEEGDGQEN